MFLLPLSPKTNESCGCYFEQFECAWSVMQLMKQSFCKGDLLTLTGSWPKTPPRPLLRPLLPLLISPSPPTLPPSSTPLHSHSHPFSLSLSLFTPSLPPSPFSPLHAQGAEAFCVTKKTRDARFGISDGDDSVFFSTLYAPRVYVHKFHSANNIFTQKKKKTR